MDSTTSAEPPVRRRPRNRGFRLWSQARTREQDDDDTPRGDTLHAWAVAVCTDPHQQSCWRVSELWLAALSSCGLVFVQLIALYIVISECVHPSCYSHEDCLPGLYCGGSGRCSDCVSTCYWILGEHCQAGNEESWSFMDLSPMTCAFDDRSPWEVTLGSEGSISVSTDSLEGCKAECFAQSTCSFISYRVISYGSACRLHTSCDNYDRSRCNGYDGWVDPPDCETWENYELRRPVNTPISSPGGGREIEGSKFKLCLLGAAGHSRLPY